MRRQNWWALVTAAFLVVPLITVSMGARIQRWEAIAWLVLAIIGNVGTWLYSRMWARD